MDVARLNFSHATHDDVKSALREIRMAEAAGAGRVAVLADLQGPKLRVGDLAQPLSLTAGERLILTRAPTIRGSREVRVPDEFFSSAICAGDRIYLKDGTIELLITGRSARSLETIVEVGGELTGRAGVSAPNLDLELRAFTARDRTDLAFAVEQGVEWVALSFVSSADDVTQARELLDQLGAGAVRVVAKIERRAALARLGDLAEVADALMVARGDLGVEVGVEEVPISQHQIIAAGKRRGVPVIVATEMLESMRDRERPTRAEASDVAHAVWDGAAAVMLSAETAIGRYPVAAVATMDRILRRAESANVGQRGPH